MSDHDMSIERGNVGAAVLEPQVKTSVLPSKFYAEMVSTPKPPERSGRELLGLFEGEYPPRNPAQLRLISSVDEQYRREAQERFRGWELDSKLRDIEKAGYDRIYDKLFDYFAATMDLELDSERTRKIQENVINRMVPEGMQTRVAIMRKGIHPNGFTLYLYYTAKCY